MIILLSIQESTNQIISGVPEFVEFNTNVPSTVFYTLDGSLPDTSSQIAVGKVLLPTDGLTLTLKAVAIAGSMSSDVLEEVYFTDHSDLDKARLVDDEGINVLPPGSTIVDHLSEDLGGDDTQASSIPFVDLGIKTSKVNRRGERIPNDSTIDFIRFPDREFRSEPPNVSSPNDNNINFDPKAKLIIVDGSTDGAAESQSVRIINRPHGTVDVVSDFYNDHLLQQPIVTGNFVRSMMNPKTGKIVFYYRESRENRWIQSIQSTEALSLNLTPIVGGGSRGFVFKWIEDRGMSKIF
jgi:hypothetical protein